MTAPAPLTGSLPVPLSPSRSFPLRPDGTWSAADADARARRLIAVRRWHRRAELAARRAARASSAVR